MSWTPPGILDRPFELGIHPYSDVSVGRALRVWAGGSASAAFPLANLALYVPFAIVAPVVAYRAWALCGTTSGNNFDVGIYSSSGTRLVSTGAVARAASAIVSADITDTYLGPGSYYLALAHNGTNTFYAYSGAAGLCQAVGVMEQTSAYTLPATATFAATTRAYIPVFGIQIQSSPNL